MIENEFKDFLRKYKFELMDSEKDDSISEFASKQFRLNISKTNKGNFKVNLTSLAINGLGNVMNDLTFANVDNAVSHTSQVIDVVNNSTYTVRIGVEGLQSKDYVITTHRMDYAELKAKKMYLEEVIEGSLSIEVL